MNRQRHKRLIKTAQLEISAERSDNMNPEAESFNARFDAVIEQKAFDMAKDLSTAAEGNHTETEMVMFYKQGFFDGIEFAKVAQQGSEILKQLRAGETPAAWQK